MSVVNRRLRVVVVDDEATAREGVGRLVSSDPELEVVAECANGRDAVSAIISRRPDLVLLDVQMPQMDGFEVVRAVGPDWMPVVIFVTAHDEFALRAFEVSALDYLLKPFDDDRFRTAIARAKRAVGSAEAGTLGHRLIDLLARVRPDADVGRVMHTLADVPQRRLARIAVKHDGSVILLDVDDIDWIEAADYCVRIHARGQAYMVRESMSALEARLDASRFFRAHRSAIVNLDRVHEIQPSVKGEHLLILHDHTKLTLSRPRRPRLEELLQQRL